MSSPTMPAILGACTDPRLSLTGRRTWTPGRSERQEILVFFRDFRLIEVVLAPGTMHLMKPHQEVTANMVVGSTIG